MKKIFLISNIAAIFLAGGCTSTALTTPETAAPATPGSAAPQTPAASHSPAAASLPVPLALACSAASRL